MPAAAPLSCYAVTAPGLEPILAAELAGLGLDVGESDEGGVAFTSGPEGLADALLGLRTANRVTVRLASFTAKGFAELERHAAKVPWGQVLPPGAAVHFRVTSKKSKLYHEDAIAERLERAAVLAIRGSEAIRSATSAEILEDDVREVPRVQRIVVRVFRDEVTLSADASGALLHRRGWRLETAKAPLRETLAAALLLGVGYDGSVPLTDPLAGSGTIPIEAALIARRIAPGKLRRFAAEAWPIVGAAPFAAARLRADARELPKSPVTIEGHDRDAGAILAAINNARRAGVLQDVSFTRAALSHLTPRAGPGWIVTNPPWGVRIGERQKLRDLYAAIGNAVHAARPDWRVALLTTERMLAAQTGLELVERWKSSSGGVNVRCFASES
ncbi:MAG TPA: hypothetical protein VFN90_05980 [Gemmatimonadales bacterium]|nr:hypothetical protein [Gemmatimonadales bacterium]